MSCSALHLQVAGFVESVALLQDLAALLPIQRRGDYVAPETPEGLNFPDHLTAYVPHLRAAGAGAHYVPQLPPGPLAEGLALYHAAAATSGDPSMQAGKLGELWGGVEVEWCKPCGIGPCSKQQTGRWGGCHSEMARCAARYHELDGRHAMPCLQAPLKQQPVCRG